MKNLLLIVITSLCSIYSYSQSIISVNPSIGNAGQTLNVTITGSNTHFTQASATYLNITNYFSQGSNSIIQNSYNVINDTSITYNLSIPNNCYNGYVDFSIYNPNTWNLFGLEDAFFVNSPSSPQILTVNPTSANAGQTLDVTITGANTHFTQASAANLTITNYFSQVSNSIIQNSYNVINDNSITYNLTISNNSLNGYVDFSIYEPNTWNFFGMKDAFFISSPTSPQILSINPTSADAGQTLDVTITGANTNFTQASSTYLNITNYFSQGSNSIIQNSYSVINDNSITYNLTIPYNSSSGFYDFSIYKPISWDLFGMKDAFFVNPNIAPSLLSVNPTSANAGQTLNVTITGANTHFTQSSATSIAFEFGQGSGTIIVNSYNIINDNNISANITIPSSIYTGNYDLSIFNSFDGNMTLNNGFHITGTTCNVTAGFTLIDNGNGSYSFTNTSSGNIVLQKWNFGDGSQSIATNPTHTFVANGTYMVVLTVADDINLTGACYDYFVAPIIVTGVSSPLICNSSFSMYTDSVTNRVIAINSSTGTNLNYLWDFGDGSSSNLIYPNHSYNSQGPFLLCLTVNNGSGCIDTYCDSIGSNGVVFKGGFIVNIESPDFVGINNNLEFISKLRIFPNPIKSDFTIELDLKNQAQVEIIVTDLLGNIVTSITKEDLNSGTNLIKMNTLFMVNGTYFLNIKTDNFSKVQKLVILK